jgi:D-threo-aldose 1-dehydrogenase
MLGALHGENTVMSGFASRRIGRTALEVTEIGLGTATLGGSRVAITHAARGDIVRAAWQAGVRYFDTAPFYGAGAAERALGDALRDEERGDWVLSSKVGRLLRPQADWRAARETWERPMPFDVIYDYSYDGIMRSFEDSFQRLGLAHIDILLVHDIGAYQHGAAAHPALMRTLLDSGYRALDELRRSGEITAIGLGVNEREVCLEAMAAAQWDVLLLAGRYTLLEQAPLDDLLPLCVKTGTSVVVGGPLNSGILAGRDSWNYAAAPPEIVARARAIGAVCDRHGVKLPAAALQFPLAHPAVAAIIPGPRSVAEFDENVALLRTPISPALWNDLRGAGLLHEAAPTP